MLDKIRLFHWETFKFPNTATKTVQLAVTIPTVKVHICAQLLAITHTYAYTHKHTHTQRSSYVRLRGRCKWKSAKNLWKISPESKKPKNWWRRWWWQWWVRMNWKYKSRVILSSAAKPHICSSHLVSLSVTCVPNLAQIYSENVCVCVRR